MKNVKVQVTKSIANGGVKFNYPEGYDAHAIMVEAYEHQGDPTKNNQTEFCYGVADDGFAENAGIVAINQATYDAAVAASKAA